MSYMPGRCWFRVSDSEITQRANIAESLGHILRRGYVSDESTAIVNTYILPCLQRLRASINESTKALQPHVERLITASPGLNKLPLYWSHHDLNEMNVLVGENDTVSGIVDWECARDLPFGMGLHRVTDTIVARNSQGDLEIPEGALQAETVFWDAVLSDAPSTVLENLDDVQNALPRDLMVSRHHRERRDHYHYDRLVTIPRRVRPRHHHA